MSLPVEGLVLDHIAVATKDLERSVDIFTSMGLKFKDEREIVTEQKVETAFAQIDMTANLELLMPVNNEGPIQKFIETRGEGIHHLCFRVDDIEKSMEELTEKGFKFIYDAPKLGAHHCKVNFIHPKSTGGILIELSQQGE